MFSSTDFLYFYRTFFTMVVVAYVTIPLRWDTVARRETGP